MEHKRRLSLVVVILASISAGPSPAAEAPGKVTVSWDKVTRVSQTTPTLQVVVNPPLRRGTAVHDNAFKALRDLGADFVRYVPWLPYPKLGVAALEPPKDGKTSWDFSLIDPMTVDFLEATKGHSVMLNFSTIPAWLHKTDKPVAYPADPDQPTWTYTQRTEPQDPTMKEIADYYARLLAWYTQGGFTDELGKRHESGHRYDVAYWEVLNEPDLEYPPDGPTYTRLYDAVVEAMRKVSPRTRFVGASLAYPARGADFFEYFLNPRNHKPGVPLDWISYHFYAVPAPDEGPEVQEYTFFTQADAFLNVVRYVESIRKRLSPGTKTTINEIGAISAEDLTQGQPGYVFRPIPNSYWNLTSAMYAYIFGELSHIGIDVAGESQLVGYPTQFPSVSMVDWTDGRPNARYWVLKLLKDNFGPGDKLVETKVDNRYVYALGAVKPDGKRRVLLVNKRNRPFEVTVPVPAAASGIGWTRRRRCSRRLRRSSASTRWRWAASRWRWSRCRSGARDDEETAPRVTRRVTRRGRGASRPSPAAPAAERRKYRRARNWRARARLASVSLCRTPRQMAHELDPRSGRVESAIRRPARKTGFLGAPPGRTRS